MRLSDCTQCLSTLSKYQTEINCTVAVITVVSLIFIALGLLGTLGPLNSFGFDASVYGGFGTALTASITIIAFNLLLKGCHEKTDRYDLLD